MKCFFPNDFSNSVNNFLDEIKSISETAEEQCDLGDDFVKVDRSGKAGEFVKARMKMSDRFQTVTSTVPTKSDGSVFR